jgi:hypothetical protein
LASVNATQSFAVPQGCITPRRRFPSQPEQSSSTTDSHRFTPIEKKGEIPRPEPFGGLARSDGWLCRPMASVFICVHLWFPVHELTPPCFKPQRQKTAANTPHRSVSRSSWPQGRAAIPPNAGGDAQTRPMHILGFVWCYLGRGPLCVCLDRGRFEPDRNPHAYPCLPRPSPCR